MKVIAFASQKGGTSKSSSAVIAAYSLAEAGERVLFLDLDSQCNSTELLAPGEHELTVKDALQGAAPEKVMRPCETGYIIPGDPFFDESSISSLDDIKTLLQGQRRRFDYAIVDCAPSLNEIVVAALAASNFVVVPSRPDSVGATATANTLTTIAEVQSKLNKKLRAGILPSMVNTRASLHKAYIDVLAQIAEAFNARMFNPVRASVAVAESQDAHKSLFAVAPKSAVAADYRTFVQELREEI